MNAILVIDDNKELRSDILEILSFENYATLEAENGLIGLQMISQHSPSLILSDVDMPVMNGIELLRIVKANPVFSKIPFVLITGHNDQGTRNTATDLGVEQYLTKPLSIAMILSTILYLLQKRHVSTQ